MKKSSRKRIVRYSILTALALDAVGYALSSGYTPKEKSKWHTSDRSIFPVNKFHKASYGIGSSNSAIFMQVLEILADVIPETSQDALTASKRISHLFGDIDDIEMTDKGLYLPVCTAIGYFAAIRPLTTEYLLFLMDVVYSRLAVTSEETEADCLIAFFIFRLCHTGFFGFHIICEAEEAGILNALKPFCDYLMHTHPDITRLKKINGGYVNDLPYSYKLLSYVVFYMLRVDTACNTGEIKSLPREQLLGILNIEGIHEQDAGFIFGAICTSSEHTHPLAPKPLRESIEFFSTVDSTLSRI